MDFVPRTESTTVSRGSRTRPKALRPRIFLRPAVLVLPVLLVLLGPAAADYYDGLRAYDSADYAGAAKEWRRAGRQGDAASQFRLAQLHEWGLGAPTDVVQAYRWYNIAASQGHVGAREARDALAGRLTTEQLSEARRLVMQSEILPPDYLKQPALSAVGADTVSGIGRFDGRWRAGVRLHFSSPKNKCGFQVIEMGIRDGAVKGNLHIGSTHFRDAAAGDYPFTGRIDRDGTLQAEGRGVAIDGVVSDDVDSVSGSWDAFGVGCRGTYEGSREF